MDFSFSRSSTWLNPIYNQPTEFLRIVSELITNLPHSFNVVFQNSSFPFNYTVLFCALSWWDRVRSFLTQKIREDAFGGRLNSPESFGRSEAQIINLLPEFRRTHKSGSTSKIFYKEPRQDLKIFKSMRTASNYLRNWFFFLQSPLLKLFKLNFGLDLKNCPEIRCNIWAPMK